MDRLFLDADVLFSVAYGVRGLAIQGVCVMTARDYIEAVSAGTQQGRVHDVGFNNG